MAQLGAMAHDGQAPPSERLMSANRDSFQRQTGMLNQGRGTAPLGQAARGTRPLMDPTALKALTEDMLGKARTSLENLHPRIELLMRACERAALPVPGVEQAPFVHPLSPKGEQIVAYLVATFQAKPELAKEVQVGVYRYHDAARVTEGTAQALEQGMLTQAQLEELKLKLFYLSRYHEEFKGDKVLAQLFPPPQSSQGGVAKPGASQAQSMVERLKAKQAREAILSRAEILGANLQPKMATVALVIQMCDDPKLNLGALFDPMTRQARLIALAMRSNGEALGQLREAHRLFGLLQGQLADARAGGEVDALKATAVPLGQLALSCQKVALLKDLFPLSDQALFPEG